MKVKASSVASAITICGILAGALSTPARATLPAEEDGYDLWLRYQPLTDANYRATCRQNLKDIVMEGASKTMVAVSSELTRGLNGLLGTSLAVGTNVTQVGAVIAGTPDNSALIRSLNLSSALADVGSEGYLIRTATMSGKRCYVIAGTTDVGVLYGAFAFLRLVQTGRPLDALDIAEKPHVQLRMLNHWGACRRLWRWDELPEKLDPRYTDYARACASVGINGSVLIDVNSSALYLETGTLRKIAALADVFRPYGIRVYTVPAFSAPMTLGNLPTADPMDPKVAQWWKDKAKEIYGLIPDFGGFLVKANSEGKPGPVKPYGRTHADGANCIARALKPYGGVVIWRAFVYADVNNINGDRVKAAYDTFKPLDGKFDDNVIVQIKNGPLDFQPREPISPLFGAMEKTDIGLELQIMQEYLGGTTHMVYLGTLWKEVLDFDTYAKGSGSKVSKVLDGSLFGGSRSMIAGVANIDIDRDWCGHPLAHCNWYAFGRLAWNSDNTAEGILDEWIPMTFGLDKQILQTLKPMLMSSRENYVNYTMPLGLNHMMQTHFHGNPDPTYWVGYQRADARGVGVDRTSAGTKAVEQYMPENRRMFEDIKTCPEKYLIWFHHVPWDYKLSTGRPLIEELYARYDSYESIVKGYMKAWEGLRGRIDPQRFREVEAKLSKQMEHAKWWRDTCVYYFAFVSGVKHGSSLARAESTAATTGRVDRAGGQVTATTDKSGEVRVVHGLGFIPKNVGVRTATPYLLSVRNRTDTNLTIRVYDPKAGETVKLSPISFSWSASM